jgi:hypothetical protein
MNNIHRIILHAKYTLTGEECKIIIYKHIRQSNRPADEGHLYAQYKDNGVF